MRKQGQEEMVGFAIILVIVAVLLLIFLGFSLNRNNEDLESDKVSGFLSAMLSYHTECERYSERVEIKDLIFYCYTKEECHNEVNSCEVLGTTLEEMLESSWKVGENTALKGYELQIWVNEDEQIGISKGNSTRNVQGAWEEYSKSGNVAQITLEIYG